MKMIKDSEGEYTAEEYAAFWGGDPCYDHSPRIPGDGYMFYNFGSEHQIRDRHFLENFLGAIQRTISAELSRNDEIEIGSDSKENNIDGLRQLEAHVRELIGTLP